MNELLYFFKILIYVLICLVIYYLVRKDYIAYQSYENCKYKLRISTALICSMLIGLFAVISFPEDYGASYGGDHWFFMHRYVNDMSIAHESVGLDFIFSVLRFCSVSIDGMFFFVISLGVFLSFLGYRKFEGATPVVILILLISEFYLYGFQALKQHLANGFAVLFFAYFLNGKKFRSIFFIVLACLFHEAAYMLIFIFILLCLPMKKIGVVPLIILTLALFVFMNDILNIITNIFPEFSEHIDAYVKEGELVNQENFMTILKGLPYYVIVVVALINRKTLKDKIKNYDIYLLLSIIASGAVLMSYYSYWIFRLSYLVVLPTYLFAIELYKKVYYKPECVFLTFGVFVAIAGLTLKYMIQMFFKFGGL